MRNMFLACCLLAAGAAAAAGCSSGGGPVTRSGPPVTPSSAASATSPATGLAATQTVLVQASGFSPGEALVVTQCAAKGTATGPGDCDLTGMRNVTADASGQVKTEFPVSKGPFGGNKIVCGPTQDCLISVTQASLSPTEEADTPISFR